MCDTNQISKHFRKPFFEIKGQKKSFQNEGFFFCSKKVEKTKKLEMRKLTKKLQKPSQREGRKYGTRKMCSFPPPLLTKKEKNKTKRTEWKNGEKKKMKNTKSEKSKRKTQIRREKQEEKGREKDEKRDTQKRCLKRKRGKSVKNIPTKNETCFREERKLFCTRKDFSSR